MMKKSTAVTTFTLLLSLAIYFFGDSYHPLAPERSPTSVGSEKVAQVEELLTLDYEKRVQKVRRRVVTYGQDHNQSLCAKQNDLVRQFEADLAWKNFNQEQAKEYSYKVLKYTHAMANELSRYSFKNNVKLLKEGTIDAQFAFDLEALQSPCKNRPHTFDQMINVMSEGVGNNKGAKNWMVYRTAEFSMTLVKRLDSFEAYQMGLRMLAVLGRQGHLMDEDIRRVNDFQAKLQKLTFEFQEDLRDSSKHPYGLKETLYLWEKKKMVTRLEIKKYLSDISKRYPTHESQFGVMNLPELI